MDIDIIAKIAATLIASGGICLLFLGCYSMGGVMDRPKKRLEQRVGGWVYNCDFLEGIIQWDEDYYMDMVLRAPWKYKKDLGNKCDCGKNCKPIKVEVIVREKK